MKINENIEITNEDNMELMRGFPDNYFDLAIVDPPYGVDISKKGSIGGIRKGVNKKWKNEKVRKFKSSDWDNETPKKEYFEELKRVSKNQIIWGGNYFTDFLPPTNAWIFWDKVPNGDNLTFSDGELAYTSFSKQLKRVIIPWIGFGSVNLKEKKIHICQKPVKLYEWILANYAEPNQKILDTHLGSGSIAIAIDNANKMDKMNLTLTACELDSDYFQTATNRIIEQTNWQSLF